MGRRDRLTTYGAGAPSGSYPKGIEVSDEEMAGLRIKGDAFHSEWNYTIMPRRR